MSGLEVIGAVTTALAVISKLTQWFKSRRNNPIQVQRLERMLDELSDRRLIAIASDEELRSIARLVEACTEVLAEQESKYRTNRLSTFFFPADAEAKLKEQNDVIAEDLTRLYARVRIYAR